jgi:hypothetical protein
MNQLPKSRNAKPRFTKGSSGPLDHGDFWTVDLASGELGFRILEDRGPPKSRIAKSRFAKSEL